MSVSGHHFSVLVDRSNSDRGTLTSPRNWFLPNLSQSHTLNHKVFSFNSLSAISYCRKEKEVRGERGQREGGRERGKERGRGGRREGEGEGERERGKERGREGRREGEGEGEGEGERE